MDGEGAAVTGASRCIERGLAAERSREGCNLALCARSAGELSTENLRELFEINLFANERPGIALGRVGTVMSA